MLRDEVLDNFRDDKETLDGFGVKMIGVFGSVARGEEGPESDVDVVVDFYDESIPGLFEFLRLKRHLEEILGRPIDLVTPGSPNKRLNKIIENEAVYA